MPAELEACVTAVMAKGQDEKSAYAICRTSLDLKQKDDKHDVIKYACDMADEKKKMFSDLKSINGVEIFASGEWNGDNYSEGDLDAIVHAFHETKVITKPYLKLGHGSKQALLEQDELPAAGYVHNIYRRGKKIVADFIDIPAKIFDLIQKRAYTGVSSEIFVDFKSNGKTYPYALKAVALLGAATKAVHSLNDILARYAEQSLDIKIESGLIKSYEFKVSEESEINTEEKENTMTLEESMRQVAKLEAEMKSFQEENAALEKENKIAEENLKVTQNQAKEYKEKAETLEKEIEKTKKESFEKEIDSEIKAYQDKGLVTAVQGKLLSVLLKNSRMNDDVKEFSVDDKKFSDVKSLVKAFVDAKVEINLDGGRSTIGSKTDDEAYVSKVNKYAKEKGITVKQATLELSESN